MDNNNIVLLLVIAFIIVLYAHYLRYTLPRNFEKLFYNNVFRFIFYFMLIYVCTNATPTTAFIVSLVFVLLLYVLNYLQMREKFDIINNISNINLGQLKDKVNQYIDIINDKKQKWDQLSEEEKQQLVDKYKNSLGVKLAEYGFDE